KQMIVGKLEYHYGQQVINPFGGQKPMDVIIIRDVEKEQEIMRLIEYANFHYNGKELYIQADDDALFDFFYSVLPLFEDSVELFLTEVLRILVVKDEYVLQMICRYFYTSHLIYVLS